MKIAILSRNPELYSTRRLVEAAKEKGHEAKILDHLRCDIIIEKGAPAIYYKGERQKDIEFIERNQPKKKKKPKVKA